MWKLHRYYLRELGVNFGITFGVMFAVVLASLVARGMQKAQGGVLLDAFKTMLLYAIDTLPHMLTIAFVLATVATYARAAQDRELLAIRAAGISPRVPMTAALLVGLGLSCLSSYANHYVLPDVYYYKFRVVAEVARSMIANLKLGSDRIPLPGGGVLTFRERVGVEFRDCWIYAASERALPESLSPILHVDVVTLPPLEKGSSEIVVTLAGVRDPVSGIEGPRFGFRWDFRDAAERNRREERDDDLRSDQLLAEVMRSVHPRPFEALYTLFRRCTFSLMPALMAPIGYCLAEWTRLQGKVVALLTALLPLLVFYFGEALGARLLRATDNPWTAWLPIVLLLPLFAPLCWRHLRR
jgi:lipopolysaccharide export LptBFGC system permease protein LptF